MSLDSSLSDFPAATRADWLERVEAVLKGARFEDRLVSSTADGIRVEPLYREISAPRPWRSEASAWVITQRIDHQDPASANGQALEDLENGAGALAIVFKGAASAHGFGLAAEDRRALERTLKDVRFDCIGLRLEPGPNGRRVAEAMAEFIDSQPVDPERLDLCFGMDPIGALAARGDLDAPWEEVAVRFAETVGVLRQHHFTGPFAVADGRIWHDGGATEAEELSFVLATGVAYLRALDQLDGDALARAVSVTLAADQDMFLTLAKFRAMRILWARILAASSLPSVPLKLHAESSWRMMSARDPQTNILRSAAATFGAGLGGANSIALLPFSMAQGLSDKFARRTARNCQSVLIEELNLWRVADPAGGAGYVEHLTEGLCEWAWAEFQTIERAGGIVNQLQAGVVQQQIAELRAALLDQRRTIIGVTSYAEPREAPAAILDAAPAYLRPKIGAAIVVEPIPAIRLAEDAEKNAGMAGAA